MHAYDNAAYKGERERGQAYYMGHVREEEPPSLPNRLERFVKPLIIIMPEIMERMAYFSIILGFGTYTITQFGYTIEDAGALGLQFAVVAYGSSFIWGFFADVGAGKYFCIVTSSLIYLIGLALLSGASFNYFAVDLPPIQSEYHETLFKAGIFVCAAGTGGIKANVAPLAGEQIETIGASFTRVFFNWYYWVINIGTLVATLGVSTWRDDLDYGFGYSLFIPMGCLAGAVIVFAAGFPAYFGANDRSRDLLSTCSICRQGCCKGTPSPNPKLPEGSEQGYLSSAKIGLGGTHDHNIVNGVAAIVKLLPIAFTVGAFWIAYAFVGPTFARQTYGMDLRDNASMTEMFPAALFNPMAPPTLFVPLYNDLLPLRIFASLNPFAILLFVPIVDLVFCNLFRAMGRPLTPLKRIVFGLFVAALGTMTAALVEIRRKSEDPTFFQKINGLPMNAYSLSAEMIIPQYALLGLAEVLVAAASLELAFTQTPRTMRSFMTGFFQLMVAGGLMTNGGLGLVLSDLDEPWFDAFLIDDVLLENFYFLVTGMVALGTLSLLFYSRRYKYVDRDIFSEREMENIEMDAIAVTVTNSSSGERM